MSEEVEKATSQHLGLLVDAQQSFMANSAARGAVGQNIAALSQQISVIESVMKQIQNISTQVRMLSINASIEAARAGAAGKGFSVVAQEVGSLAQNTGLAVTEIEQGVAAMHSIIEKTKNDMASAKKIGSEFDEKLAACVDSAKELALVCQGDMPQLVGQ